ncbi:hypothetical protein SAMN05216490_0637 [Mucilaginibacter mallensis]|uniref:Uncharacterized protein n=1 Tax=Mucilaginibacter mallensis TaxID=652787 RepID=A0A1H1PW90_MUCMA|nr:hypothetical protein [Mucilaginibacter mallensis]SDS15478.1 hypothetical protein SAMN05216490_0637 [Mucilaginibacter mallensis]
MELESYNYNITSAIIKAAALMLMLFTANSIYAQKNDNDHRNNIGLIYPLSSNYTSAPRDTNNFSLNLLAGVSAGERGFSLAGLSNVIHGDATGVQIAGFSNHIGKNANGVMVAGFINTYTQGKGTAVAGFANIARNNTGTQVAGFLNTGGDVSGLQLAGFMNVAKKLKGTQVSFINIADSAGTQIGIINIAKNNDKSIGVSIDENETTMLSFRSGGKLFYGIIGIGGNLKNTKEKYAYEAGLGVNILREKAFSLKTELITSGLESFKGDEYFKSSSYLMPAFKITRSIEIFGGPSFNYVETDNVEGRNLVKKYVTSWTRNNGSDLYGLYFGYTAGIQFHF